MLSVTYTPAANTAPVANAELYAVVPGQPLVVAAPGILANDIDVDEDTLTAVLVDDVPAGQGTLTLNADGSFTYDPGSFIGTTSFTYRAEDTSATQSNLAAVTLSMGPTFVMTVDSTSVDEDSSTITATVTLINGTTTFSTADFATVDGTAKVGTDYVAVSQTVSLTGGTTPTQIAIQIVNDEADPVREGVEQFSVKLSNPSVNSIISGDTGSGLSLTITIDDQQDIPTFQVAGASAPEGASTSTALIAVSLVGKSLLTSTVGFTTSGTTTPPFAEEVKDYVAASTTLVFQPNSAAASFTQTIAVQVLEDNVDEFDQILEVRLSGGMEPSTALTVSISATSSQVTILDNDPAPSLAIHNRTANETDATTTVAMGLTGASSAGVSVDVLPSGGSATPGVDYALASTALSWAPDEGGTKTFTVTLFDDALLEGAELANFTLANETTTGASAEGVVVEIRSARLRIIDDEAPHAIPGMRPLGTDAGSGPLRGRHVRTPGPTASPGLRGPQGDGVGTSRSCELVEPLLERCRTACLYPIRPARPLVRRRFSSAAAEPERASARPRQDMTALEQACSHPSCGALASRWQNSVDSATRRFPDAWALFLRNHVGRGRLVTSPSRPDGSPLGPRCRGGTS